jgi:carboxypeptidase Q
MKRALVVLAIGCAPAPAPSHVPAWVAETKPYGSPATSATPAAATPAIAPAAAPTAAPAAAPAASQGGSLAARYREPVEKLVATAAADREAYRKLAYLTDRIGHRLSGSTALSRAIAWAAQTMKADGHEVRTEKVMVPHWVRGAESAELTAPVARPLRVLGLGGTVGTPRGGITARVVVVRNWDELQAKAEQV